MPPTTHPASHGRLALLRGAALLAAVLLSLGAARDARATVVLRASLDELAAVSDVIVHGVVRVVDDDLSEGPTGPFCTRIEVEVVEAIKGVGSTTRIFTFELPGGRAGNRIMRIPGMPRFHSGDEVVLLLEPIPRGGYALAGLSQGVFRVDRATAVPSVRRNLKGLETVRRPGAESAAVTAMPSTLAELKQRLRELTVAGGAR